jgi:hypothetical protein
MARNRFFIFLLCACCVCAVWVANVSLIKSIARHFGDRPRSAAVRGDAAVSGTSALVDSALGLVPVTASAGFGGKIENPFKIVSEAREVAPSAPRAAPTDARPAIVLKGILYKSNPLAILENAAGTTSILGVGDTILGRRVEAISKTSVTLRDRHGSCVLSVKE